MVKFTVPIADILGSAYYTYDLYPNTYSPTVDSTVTITCICKNVFGNPVANKSLMLYRNNNEVGTATTNANGIATWSVTLYEWGEQSFKVANQVVNVYVTGMKRLDVNNNLTIWYNEGSRTVMGRYSNSSVSTSNTQETVIATEVIPSAYRPPSDVKVPFNQTGSIIFFKSNGNISIRTSSSGSHNVSAVGPWIV